MKNSVILEFVYRVYKKLMLYYENSLLYSGFRKLSRWFKGAASGSSVAGFFGREWNIEKAWKDSFTFRLLIMPVKIFMSLSDKLSAATNNMEEGSAVVVGLKGILGSIFNISTRVWGLLLLAFAGTQGLLDIVLKQDFNFSGLGGIIWIAIFLLGALLILINRSLSALYEGSFVARLIADFFTVRGLNNGTGNK
ncbi:MAG: hypothetical protein ACM3TR_16730 [Caulobacteraceae bacterium]